MRISRLSFFFFFKDAGNGSKTSLVIAAIWQYSLNITSDLPLSVQVLSLGKLENLSREAPKTFRIQLAKEKHIWGRKLDLSAKRRREDGAKDPDQIAVPLCLRGSKGRKLSPHFPQFFRSKTQRKRRLFRPPRRGARKER